MRGVVFLAGLVVVLARGDDAVEERFCYYTELGFDPDADIPPTESVIKKAYRALSREFHPDINQNDEVRQRRYLRIQEAYRVIGDARLRKVYDLMGHEGVKKYEEEKNRPDQHQGGGFPFFGRPASERGPTSKLRLKVPLQKVYNGDFVTLNIAKNKLCNRCKGTGAFSKEHMKPCKACGGAGHRTEAVQFGPFVQHVKQPCSVCGAKGKVPSRPCPVCHAKKVVKRDVPLEIALERGLPEGHEVTFELEGEESPDQLPGDLVLEIRTDTHPVFRRDGNDLHATVKLSLVEALIGFRKVLRHLDDRQVVLEHRGVTPPDTVRQIPGEGMPIHHVPADRGTLHVHYEVELPTNLTDAQKKALADAFPRKPPPGGRPFATN